jgi:P-type Cu+ transporter
VAARAPERSGTSRVDLPIEGMTCGACAARIERGLGRLDGVASASVNLAAERATVVYDPAVTGPPAFAAKVAALGYAVGRDPAADPGDQLRARLVAAAALTLPVLALAMVPALQYRAGSGWPGSWPPWPARAPSALPPRPRSWSPPAAAPSSAS